MTEAKKIVLEKEKLPEGWVTSTLGYIASYIQRGKSPKYTLAPNHHLTRT